jgi:ATP-binding cassette, subfamily C, bacterial CydC
MKVILRLLGFLRGFTGEVLLSILTGIATISAGIGMLGTSAYLIASAALHPSIADLQVAIVGVRFFGISRSVFRYLERLVSHSVNLRVLSNIRSWFYRKIEPLAPAGLQDFHSGDLLNRVMADLETLQDFYVRVVSPLVVAVVVTAGMIAILGAYDPLLGGVLLVGMFLNGFVNPTLFILLSRTRGEKLLEARSELSMLTLEFFQGLEDLQAVGATEIWQAKIDRANKAYARLQSQNGFITGLNEGLILLVSNGTVFAVLLVGISLVNVGTITGVSMAVVTLLAMASFEAVNPLPLAAQNLMSSHAAAKRLFEVVDGKVGTIDLSHDLAVPLKVRGLDVRAVTFAYPGSERPVLEGVSLIVRPGEKVALVGPSGAGKTTLIELLLGFWKPQRGEINFDMIDNQLANDRGPSFGVISQNAHIFSETLRENLLLANPKASEAEMLDALTKVDLRDWYATLPDGLDTWLGERGSQMSGGERQRLALARVILQDAPFVLLDEPTTQLDPLTARSVMASIFLLLDKKSLLLVTHQLELIKKADRIYFIDGGRIRESGTWSELLTRQGDLANFHRLQRGISS